MADISQIQIEEYKFLRQEHENNRKFVFERPLVIVGSMLAASMGFKGTPSDMLGLLPILLLVILWFNLWFTHNRLQSSARIVGYIQLIHEGQGALSWIGWENSLLKYREWIIKKENKKKADQKNFSNNYDSMGFYLQIYIFHLICAILFVPLNLIQYGTFERYFTGKLGSLDFQWAIISATALLIFLVTLLRYSPSRIKGSISMNCEIWRNVLELKNAVKVETQVV